MQLSSGSIKLEILKLKLIEADCDTGGTVESCIRDNQSRAILMLPKKAADTDHHCDHSSGTRPEQTSSLSLGHTGRIIISALA